MSQNIQTAGNQKATPIVRNIHSEDYLEVVTVIRKAIQNHQALLYPHEITEKLYEKYNVENFRKTAKETTYFVAEDSINHKLLGIIGLRLNEVITFFVDPNHQGRGIGSALYSTVEQFAKKQNIQELVLQSSAMSLSIFRHYGFKAIETAHYQGRSGIAYSTASMKKRLV